MNRVVWKMATVFFLAAMLVLGVIATTFRQYDPWFNEQWSLNGDAGIDIKKVWNNIESNKLHDEVVIAIIDTGIDFKNFELDGLQWINTKEVPNNRVDDDNDGYVDDVSGYDFFNDAGSDYSDDLTYHGTISAEIIGAKHNGLGIEGIIGEDMIVRFMDIRVSESNDYYKRGDVSIIADAVKYAEKMGADICNMSFSSEYECPGLEKAMKDSKMLFVVSAGNNISGWKTNIDKKKIYPAEYELNNMIVVTNINEEGEIDESAAYGKNKVDIAAPGSNIIAVDSSGDKICITGTSFAVSHVTGIAAIIKSLHPKMNAKDIKSLICDSAVATEKTATKCKYGVINMNSIINLESS